jgi:hypothetical protein
VNFGQNLTFRELRQIALLFATSADWVQNRLRSPAMTGERRANYILWTEGLVFKFDLLGDL